MNPAELCREVSAWIDPLVVHRSVARVIAGDPAAMQPGRIALLSNVLQSGTDSNLERLVRRYLEHFTFPAGLIDLLARDARMTGDALAWLRDLRFEGEIVLDPPVQVEEPSYGVRALLGVEERDVMVDILINPLQALMKTVEVFTASWRSVPRTDEGPMNVFLRHSSDGAFLVHVEVEAAEACGYPGMGLAGVADDITNFGYRYYSICVPELPVDDRFVQAVRGFATQAVV